MKTENNAGYPNVNLKNKKPSRDQVSTGTEVNRILVGFDATKS